MVKIVEVSVRLGGINICVSGKHGYRTTCRDCPYYVDADTIIHYLLDALEKEHTGSYDIYLENLKNEFGYEKSGVLNDVD